MSRNIEKEVLSLFKECDALLRGHFKLTSGKHSEWYFEKIRLIEKPATLERLVNLLVERILEKGEKFDYIVSPAYGAIAIGFLTALKLKKRFAFTQRLEEKMSLRSSFSGIEGGRALIVEDVVTTGGSVKEVVDCLKQKGVVVTGIFSLVDRSGGELLIEGQGVKSLLAMKVENFEPEDCPLCKARIPIMKPGASDKKSLINLD